MHSNKELYFEYNTLERVQLAMPLLHLESVEANEWFVEMMDWNLEHAKNISMDKSVKYQIDKLK